MKKLIIYMGFFSFCFAYSQNTDSVYHSKNIEEIIIIGQKSLNYPKESKPLSTLDEYLENSGKTDKIRRGNYAWEPVLNSMTTERTSVTIDGMKLFSACTDKMDPVTSYVEISNLKEVSLSSGLQGGIHGGNSIGGSINLKLNKTGFSKNKWNTLFNTGYESNGNYHINGADLAFSSPEFYANLGAFHRKSENYEAGNHQEVYFSQFEKFNTYLNWGYQFSRNRILEGTLIYDEASHVGYPALPMDVKSARAWITSLSYKKEKISDIFSLWETKIYYNSINHIMDDTKRPEVPIHMDMPGFSKTYGFYSLLRGKLQQHAFSANWDGYYNQSKAEMTMYSKNPAEKPMFMYTWPDVRTFTTGIFLEDTYQINQKNSLYFSTRIGVQRDGIESDVGLRSIQIFYPDIEKYRNRFLSKAATYYQYSTHKLNIKIGGGYGERAPSVSEGYGFYLFNSFDNYDYIGNPSLKKEKSWEGTFSLAFKTTSFDWNIETSYFYFTDYILGKPRTTLSPMTLGARGVKIYTNVDNAFIWSNHLQINYRFSSLLEWRNQISYHLGKYNHDNSLPLISPLMYNSGLFFKKNKVTSEIQIKGAGKHTEYNSEFGESKTSDYLIYTFSLGYNFRLDAQKLVLKAGVENIFDKKYSTYSDWNQIPRKGRNYFVNVVFSL